MVAIHIPVVCPSCGSESLLKIDVAAAAAALLRGDGISLHAPCHDLHWAASDIEREQMREYFGSAL